MGNILLISLYIFLPFGELLRLDFGNGIAITPLDVLAGINVLFILFQVRRLSILTASPLVKAVLFFILAASISLVVNAFSFPLGQVATGSLYLLRFTSYASFFITAKQMNNRSRHLWYVYLSGVVFGILGVLQYFLYPNLQNLYYAGWDKHYYRLFSTFLDPNFAGIFLVLTFLLGLSLLITQKLQKNVFFIVLVLNLFLLGSIFLTFSRSAFLALFAGLLMLFFLIKQSRRYILLGIGLSILAIIVIALNSQFNEGTKLFRAASSIARLDSFRDAMIIFSKNPIIGTGFDLYRYAGYKYQLAHGPNWEVSHSGAGVENSLAFVLATTGIVGLFAYLYLLFVVFKRALQKNTIYRTIILAVTVALLVDSFFVNSLFFPYTMVWLWIMLGLTENG